jgi:hypothetical protein
MENENNSSFHGMDLISAFIFSSDMHYFNNEKVTDFT